MSAEAARHQHVINHLASREAAYPQGLDPVELAVWGARRDCFERPKVDAPLEVIVPEPACAPCAPMPVVAMPAPQCVPQAVSVCAPQPMMCAQPTCAPQQACNPCQQQVVAGGYSRQAFSYVDFGGKYSAAPEYDAIGSPHGYYGNPAKLTSQLNEIACNAPQMSTCNPCNPCGPSGSVPFYGNAYPSQPGTARGRGWDSSYDGYYNMREREIYDKNNRPRTVTRVVERPVVKTTRETVQRPVSSRRYSYGK